jgi:hypothetical protein
MFEEFCRVCKNKHKFIICGNCKTKMAPPPYYEFSASIEDGKPSAAGQDPLPVSGAKTE